VDGAAELERAYRAEATQIRAALAARLGDVGLAEELVQTRSWRRSSTGALTGAA
jgi:predicted RNA polymerase sigma factor